MKFIVSVFLIVEVLTSSAYGQVKDASLNLKFQADKLGRAFLKGDYKTFVNYSYPAILELMGGASKMIEVLSKTQKEMDSKGIHFISITFEQPSKIVKSNRELQATIVQHTETKLPQERLITTSILIAISTDNGMNWTFMDTSNKNIISLRRIFPNLSTSIYMPPPTPPVRYNN